MVCLDGGLERLIRILRQVPRSPCPPPHRGLITKEMQAVWKWSLAFQCVVNIGVRGSENVRTRVVEAGMVPVAVRVLESYLKVVDAIRDERKREARREEAKQRMERASESTAALDVATPTAATTRRAVLDATPLQSHSRDLPTRERYHVEDSQTAHGQASQSIPSATRPATPAEAALTDFVISADNSSTSSLAHRQEASSSHSDNVAPIIAPLSTTVPVAGTDSPSSSGSSILASVSTHNTQGTNDRPEHTPDAFASGTLTNVSSVEDFTASGSGSEGTEDVEMDVDEGELSTRDDMDSRTTPRPPRRTLAPSASQSSSQTIPLHPADGRTRSEAQQPSGSVSQPTVTQASHSVSSRTQATPATQSEPRTDRQTTRADRDRDSQLNLSDMVFREEEVLLSLQLLAYLSKYAHVRSLFHRDLASLHSLDPLETLEGWKEDSKHESDRANKSWTPSDAPKRNVFCVAERYTLRSSRTGLSHFATLVESRIAPEIQYWAGVIMRNACRKDEKQGGIRQCANMLCGKWERQPREFAKCRRCRKAKYCSKQCQSKGWQMGHRFWCSARSDEDQSERSKSRVTSETVAESVSEGGAEHPRIRSISHDNLHARTLSQDDSDAGMDVTREPLQEDSDAGARVSDNEHVSRQEHALPPLNLARRGPSVEQSGSSFASTRRTVSAIPQHLQAPDSSSTTRSRTTSTASSNADASDMSDDEMERASRRVLQSTVAPAQRSPAGVHLTSLANVTNAGDLARDTDVMDAIDANRPHDIQTRTDLAGRPLPPPVIAQHDTANHLNVRLAPEAEVLMGGRMTPAAAEDNEAGVFGRGDFDQMIWRGRTPSIEEQDDASRQVHRRLEASSHFSASHLSTDDTSETDIASPDGPSRAGRHHHQPTPSMLNSALLLAGNEEPPGHRYPSASLHAPIARQTHRFASVNAATVSSSLGDVSTPAPTSPRLPSSGTGTSYPRLTDTFAGWSNEQGHSISASPMDLPSPSHSAAAPLSPFTSTPRSVHQQQTPHRRLFSHPEQHRRYHQDITPNVPREDFPPEQDMEMGV